MGVTIKVNGLAIKDMVTGSTLGQVAVDTKVNTSLIRGMVTENSLMQIGLNMMDNSQMTIERAREDSSGLMAHFSREILSMIKCMAKADVFGPPLEMSTTANGLTERRMGLAQWFTGINLCIRATGQTIREMVMER